MMVGICISRFGDTNPCIVQKLEEQFREYSNNEYIVMEFLHVCSCFIAQVTEHWCPRGKEAN